MIHILFNNIDKSFSDRRILAGVDIQVAGGECQLLCGDNGAGKSTLLRILAGMERPTTCEVIDGHGRRRWRRARPQLLRDFIYLHQQPYLFEGTVEHNLRYPVRGSRQQRAQFLAEGVENFVAQLFAVLGLTLFVCWQATAAAVIEGQMTPGRGCMFISRLSVWSSIKPGIRRSPRQSIISEDSASMSPISFITPFSAKTEPWSILVRVTIWASR